MDKDIIGGDGKGRHAEFLTTQGFKICWDGKLKKVFVSIFVGLAAF